jgi:hypothetical protein
MGYNSLHNQGAANLAAKNVASLLLSLEEPQGQR